MIYIKYFSDKMQFSADEMQYFSNIYEICFLTFSLFYECSDFNKISFGGRLCSKFADPKAQLLEALQALRLVNNCFIAFYNFPFIFTVGNITEYYKFNSFISIVFKSMNAVVYPNHIVFFSIFSLY